MEYLTYQQTEQIFELCPTLENLLDCLTVDMQAFLTEEYIESGEADDSIIYNLCVRRRPLNGMPPSTDKKDVTADIAEKYEKVINKLKKGLYKELHGEILLISAILQKINISLQKMPKVRQKILQEYYWTHASWTEILSSLEKEQQFMSKRQAQREREEGIRYIMRVSKITLSDYNKLFSLLDMQIKQQ